MKGSCTYLPSLFKSGHTVVVECDGRRDMWRMKVAKGGKGWNGAEEGGMGRGKAADFGGNQFLVQLQTKNHSNTKNQADFRRVFIGGKTFENQN